MVWLSFEEARTFVQGLGFKNVGDWRAYCKSGNKPKTLPSNPDLTYKGEWRGYGDWLGTGFITTHAREYLPFEKARAFVHTLEIKGQSGWYAYARSGHKPENIPATPAQVYQEQWHSWGDWLGTGTIAHALRQYLPFEEARTFVRALGLRSRKEWKVYCQSGKKPDTIPSAHPEEVYRAEWHSWGDWLGTKMVAPHLRQYLPFEEARAFVHSLGLKGSGEWRAYCKLGTKPENIPNNPEYVYRKVWHSWGDWLGTGTIQPGLRQYRPFEEARAFVWTLGLRGVKQWQAYCSSGQKPPDIPAAPDQVYDDAFLSWGDWLCGVSRSQTLIEQAVSDELKKRGIAYVEQKRIGKYKIDFFVEELNLCLECAGCYWHACLRCGYNRPNVHTNLVKKRTSDERRTAFLQAKGYHVAHVWEHDILLDVEEAVTQALSALYL